MVAPSSIRLIIAESSENRAHELDSTLRNAGLATRFDVCQDLKSIEENLARESCDLMLFNASMDHLDQVLPDLRKNHPELPIILLSSDEGTSNHNMELGATDVVCPEDNARLLHVVQRELKQIDNIQLLHTTRQALEEAEKRCELLLASSSAAIAYVHEGMHIHANGLYLDLFGFEGLEELEGLPLLDLADPDSLDELKQQLTTFRDSHTSLMFDFYGQNQKGEGVLGEMTLSSATYEGESCTQVIFKALSEPVTVSPQQDCEITQSPETVADAAVTESAPAQVETLPVAAQASDLNALILASRGKSSGALLVVEIDKFEELQAQHGITQMHSAADQVFDALNDQDKLFRLSVYQFGALLESGSMVEHEEHANLLIDQTKELTINNCTNITGVSVSIGAVEMDGHESLSPLETAFFTLVNGRKASGINSVTWDEGDESDDSQLAQHRRQNKEQGRLLQSIDAAIAKKRFSLLFQPIISLRGDSDEHYEVFLRMQDDDNNQIKPAEFLEAAKQNGAAGKIDRWVILQAVKILTEHRAKGHATRLTINLTCNSVRDPDFMEWLSVAIKAASLPSDAVIFQVTEADAAAYPKETIKFIKDLKALHCRCSLGRFGLEKEPFKLLQELEVDFVKLDGSLVNGDDKNLFGATIKELQACGKLSIVPMVESASVLASLWQAGANYIQGHYLQAPATEMDFDFSTED